MAATYRFSTCNIGASASRNANEGCFRARDADIASPIIIATSYLDTSLPNAEYLIESHFYTEIVHEMEQPLFSRGWVFQERVLSARMLHFGSEYTFWNCETTSCSEKYPNGYLVSQFSPGVIIPVQLFKTHEERKYQLWANVVKEYSPLSLTYPSDRLMAVSGVCQHLQTLIPCDKYLAGLVGGFFMILERPSHILRTRPKFFFLPALHPNV